MIKIYGGTVTQGVRNGIVISEGTGLNPVTTAPLNAWNNEEGDPIRLAVRTDAGYRSYNEVTISLEGATENKWRVAPNVAGAPGAWSDWGGELNVGYITDVNTLFWVQAKATNDEVTANDESVKIKVSAFVIKE